MLQRNCQLQIGLNRRLLNILGLDRQMSYSIVPVACPRVLTISIAIGFEQFGEDHETNYKTARDFRCRDDLRLVCRGDEF